MARKSRRTRRLRVVNPDCAGIDIGKGRHFVAVDPERSDEPVRRAGGEQHLGASSVSSGEREQRHVGAGLQVAPIGFSLLQDTTAYERSFFLWTRPFTLRSSALSGRA